MSSIPYNYGKYIDDKVSMTNNGHVDASKQINSPASAGSRGLAKTTQFTNNPTQMKMGESITMEDMKSLISRIDGLNVPTNEAPKQSDIDYAKLMLQISAMKDRIAELPIDDDRKTSALTALGQVEDDLAMDESAVQEDDDESYGYEWECANCGTENEFEMSPQERAEYIKDWEEDNQDLVADGETGLDALNNLLDTGAESGMHYGEKCIKCGTEATNPYQNEDEMARLKELSGIEENAKVKFSPEQIKQLKMWNKKYSVYSGKNGDELPTGLIKANTDSGITSDGYEENEVKQYEKMFGKEEFDWDDEQHGEFQERSKITGGMMSDLEKIVGVGNADDEYTLAEIGEKILGMSFGDTYKEQYKPFPEADEMTFEDDDAFYEAFGELGFPEDETELFDAEYRGRKVPLNKPMRGDVKKFKVYVKDPKTGNVKKVNFGHGGSSARKAGQKTMKIRKSNPKARKSFRARHNCANPGPKTKARYWSCRKW